MPLLVLTMKSRLKVFSQCIGILFRFGPRFPAMNEVYSRELRDLGIKVAHELKMDGYTREGVYVGVTGPAYETPAESRFLRVVGADAVGMSTVLEATVAKHADMKIFGMSLITDMSSTTKGCGAICTREEVLAMSLKRVEVMKSFLTRLVKQI